jgi:hypothetical protein
MAWSFRKSLNFGPLRVNLSKKGLGFSIGGRGFRAGRDAQGRGYSQMSIPGTGIYNRQYLSSGGGGKAPQPIPSQRIPPKSGAVQAQKQISPSTKYLALLMGGGGLVWLLMRLFIR